MTDSEADQQRSYLTEEVMGYVGRMGRQSRPLPVEVLPCRRFAEAVEDANPLYWDQDAAAESCYGRIVAPPTFFGQNMPDLERIEPPVPVSHSTGMVGELEWEFRRPVLLGERVIAQRGITEIVEKPSRTLGLMVLVVAETTYRTEEGEVVAIHRLTRVRY